MKKSVYTLLAGFLISIGIGVYNGTGTDITLENGQTIKTHDLKRSLTKQYKTRNTEDSLYITFHHTAGSKKQSMSSIAAYHVEQRGYPEIAYHIAINEDGDVHLLNEIEEITWHDSGENTRSIGVVFVGNYEEYKPSDAMIDSGKIIAEWLCENYNIKGIRAHRDTSPTLCCGKYAYERMKNIFY